MTRKATTVMLETGESSSHTTQTIENALRDVPGALRVHVNTATDTAYVEYDADQCKEEDFERAVESVGVHTVHSAGAWRQPVLTSSPFSAESFPMRNTDRPSRMWWAFTGFVVIAGFFLFTEHRAHLFGLLPFLFLLACPFLHMFGHGGHGGGHGGYERASGPGAKQYRSDSERPDPRGTAPTHHQHSQSATRDDWRN